VRGKFCELRAALIAELSVIKEKVLRVLFRGKGGGRGKGWECAKKNSSVKNLKWKFLSLSVPKFGEFCENGRRIGNPYW
jgi:hypothetical protein